MVIGGVAVWGYMRARVQNDDRFEAVSARVLRDAQQSFLQLAESQLGQHHITSREELEKRQRAVEEIVKPIAESLSKVDGKLELLERARREAQGSLTTHLESVTKGQDQLRTETANLVTALRSPHTRGRWGEMQLRRVCELAGMVERCDFVEQSSLESDAGRLRPDVVVQLPGGKNLVIDAKAPLDAYLSALQATDPDVQAEYLKSYGRHIRDHIAKLSQKAYWSQFDSSPEFVVMFLPGEALYSAALEQMPGLIEDSVGQKVLVTSPTTLIAALRSAAYGWKQEKVAESAREVSALGRELHSRLGVLAGHFMKLGRSLESSVKAYNETVGSLESRVLVTARKLSDHGAASGEDELPAPQQVETAPRSVQVDEAEDEQINVHRLPQAAG
ncbi:MAG TPA: DNA recombination protein RmuC [Thermoleophilaceae bacterium]|nr:DNA recombination protein RmuC [Thermoleophilaceae bacterium]